LELDYKIPARANSGIMLRCSEDQPTAWATGIEYQIVDNINPEGDTEMAGWAYDLYKPADDPKTGKPLDATKPFGHWNHVKIVYDGRHVEHWMNGVKYVEYELWSDDWNQRVAKSKFAAWPKFAQARTGYIALQDHGGEVAFRNIKIRPIKGDATIAK